MNNRTVHILWDDSQLWGVMVFRAMRAFGVNCRLVKTKEIAQGSLMRKCPSLLMAPGGSARNKASALGTAGLAAIRDWVAAGGMYLGFCGGAGLALSHADAASGLGICPWRRRSFPDRLYHLLSGHLRARSPLGPLQLPVWWPGRFEEREEADVKILARYESPGRDLWLADLPLMEIPETIWAQWSRAGRLDMSLDFPAGLPLVIAGKYGCGSYILSYAHLETPGSVQANAWLGQMLEQAGIAINSPIVPQWRTDPQKVYSGHESGMKGEMAAAHRQIWQLVLTAQRAGILFQRAPWLWGWRRGMPGMTCNHLLAYLSIIGELDATLAAETVWQTKRETFWQILLEFAAKAEAFFWNCRLGSTLRMQEQSDFLAAERDSVFGHQMLGGGLIQQILDILEDIVYLDQPENDQT